MTAPRFSRLAMKLLTRTREPRIEPASVVAREDAIRALRIAIGRRRRRFRAIASLTALAAVVIGVMLVRSLSMPTHTSRFREATAPRRLPADSSPEPRSVLATGDGALVANAGSAPLAGGQPLRPGSRVVASGSGHTLLAFSTGTRLSLADDGDLTLVDDGPTQIVKLAKGTLRAEVAKLAPSERFLVRTPDAEIEVRGTVFTVRSVPSNAACGDGSTTRVAVEEGTVIVRRAGGEAVLHATDEWPRGCSPISHAAVHRQLPAPSAPSPSSSTIAAQNDLFAAAVAAKSGGDPRGAVVRFSAFLERYPSSPLAESASVHRMHLLRDFDPPHAREAARAYLSTYPNGFARAEAHAILVEP